MISIVLSAGLFLMNSTRTCAL